MRFLRSFRSLRSCDGTVSPQDAPCRLLQTEAGMYPQRGFTATVGANAAIVRPVYYDGTKENRVKLPGSRNEQVKGAAPHTAPVHIGRQRRPRKTPVFGGFSEASCRICMVAPLRCCHTSIV